jgi:hypothetical protein
LRIQIVICNNKFRPFIICLPTFLSVKSSWDILLCIVHFATSGAALTTNLPGVQTVLLIQTASWSMLTLLNKITISYNLYYLEESNHAFKTCLYKRNKTATFCKQSELLKICEFIRLFSVPTGKLQSYLQISRMQAMIKCLVCKVFLKFAWIDRRDYWDIWCITRDKEWLPLCKMYIWTTYGFWQFVDQVDNRNIM